ncbi:hypothetical protein EFE23_26710 [Micromonospora solifontis]|uniref:Virus attachment protein p12 family protein n=1 Tax=Micromonospora solifontis TaxID=2487138 RepID=A0ABX9W8H1_9ACTN|nr:hypothetical protein EFE23_26710 [Micromonospora solifontis]
MAGPAAVGAPAPRAPSATRPQCDGRTGPGPAVRHRPIEVIAVLFGVLAALVVGYVAGLVSFKIKDRWCPQCGSTTIARDQVRRAR